MIAFLLRLFAVVVFVLLAATWVIHSKQLQWAYGASGAFVASFLVDGPVPAFTLPRRRQPQQ